MGRKDFNKGMEAGAKPFEGKFRQMGKQFQEFSNKIEQDLDRIKDTNDAILDEMDSMQRENFYKANTMVDIAVLDKGDRQTLLSLLFTLAEMEENVNEYQQLFIRSVKKYLEKAEEGVKPEKWSILKDGDWSIVETIDGIDETKAIVQAVMEFLFLGYGNHEEYFEEYADLFECFNLNRRGFGEIQERINNIFHAAGMRGIAENYGYVPEESAEEASSMQQGNLKQYGTYGTLEELRITETIRLVAGEEKAFENKRIIFENVIEGEGFASGNKLIFKNCEIIIQEELKNKKAAISGLREGTITFENCTITNGKTVLIDECDDLKLTLKNSCLNCGTQIYNARGGLLGPGKSSVSIKHCRMILMKDRGNENIISCYKFEMFDTFVSEEQEKDAGYDFHLSRSAKALFGGYRDSNVHIEESRFCNVPNLLLCARDEIAHSVFEKCCVKLCDGGWGNCGLASDCKFQNCTFAESYGQMNFEDSKLLSCIGILPAKRMKDVTSEGGFLVIWGVIDLELMRCQFSNWSAKAYENTVDKNGNALFSSSHITIGRREREAVIVASGYNKIVGCRFENLDVGERYLMGGSHADRVSFEVRNCHFKNIQTGSKEIFREKFHYKVGGFLRDKEAVDTISVRTENCIGV